MNIQEAAHRCSLSIDTIRFYEKSGMLPKLARDKRGWRNFDPHALEWLVILQRLRATGMPLAHVKRFATLVFAPNTASKAAKQERLAILERHKMKLAERKKQLSDCEAYLDHKIAIYAEDLGKIK
jgi:MerR family transcriptional regulator, aldehyde-responsive regulator